MAVEMCSWELLKKTCPKETTAISGILSEYAIELNGFFMGVADQVEWDKVVDIRGMHLEISETDEAKLEETIVKQLIEAWELLQLAFEEATEHEGDMSSHHRCHLSK